MIFTYGGANLFYGFLFKTRQNRDTCQCTAYDQLRYLKAKYTIMRPVEPLDAFLNRACATIGDRIRLGQMDKTEINLSKYFFDNQSLLDMIYQSIQDNLLLNSYYYTLRDNFGAIDLRDTVDLRLPLVIGDSSLATGFEHTKSIDDDSYNYIVVAKDDKSAGVRNTYVSEDSINIGQWGKLMHYEKVSADLNEAQLKDRAARLLALKNRETVSLSVECVGDTRVIAGSGVKVEIEEAGLDMWALVDSATHTFEGSNHTMKLNLRYGWWY